MQLGPMLYSWVWQLAGLSANYCWKSQCPGEWGQHNLTAGYIYVYYFCIMPVGVCEWERWWRTFVYPPPLFPGAIFFSANEDCFSANHMARILIWRRISLTSRKHLQYVYAHVHVRTMYLKYAPYDWLKYWGMAILVCRKQKRRPGYTIHFTCCYLLFCSVFVNLTRCIHIEFGKTNLFLQ